MRHEGGGGGGGQIKDEISDAQNGEVSGTPVD